MKLNFGPREGTPSSTNGDGTSARDNDDAESLPLPELTPDLGFDTHELALPPRQLYRLLRRQIHWAEVETSRLKRQWQELEPKRKEAFLEKEAALTDVIDAEGRLSKLVHEAQLVAVKEAVDNAPNTEEEAIA